MLKHILIFLSTYLFVLLLVSSEDQFRTSSSVLHAKTQPKNVAFEDLGNYSGQSSTGINYKKTYFISRYFKSFWPESKSICNSFNMELATFETLDEAQNFVTILEKNEYFKANGRFVLVDGVTDLQGSSTEWFWTNSGEKIPYSIPWAAAQPDNFYNNEPVLSVGRISMDDKVGFNDIPANYAARFACQKTELIKN